MKVSPTTVSICAMLLAVVATATQAIDVRTAAANSAAAAMDVASRNYYTPPPTCNRKCVSPTSPALGKFDGYGTYSCASSIKTVSGSCASNISQCKSGRGEVVSCKTQIKRCVAPPTPGPVYAARTVEGDSASNSVDSSVRRYRYYPVPTPGAYYDVSRMFEEEAGEYANVVRANAGSSGPTVRLSVPHPCYDTSTCEITARNCYRSVCYCT